MIQADYVTVGVSRVREVRHLRSQSGMVSDQPTRHETSLVMMYLGNRPRANPAVNQVSVHLAIRVHRRYRMVVGDKGWVAFLEEKAEVGQLEITAIRTI